jgi:hypothetical protein
MHIHLKMRAHALELLLNHDDGAFAQQRRWSFCSTKTMELLLNHDDGAFAQLC